jgi:hypothetical protein
MDYDSWRNLAPLDAEVADAAADLRRHADAIESAYARRTVESSARKMRLIADAREAIEKAKASGHRWQLWQELLDEWSNGSEDERGTANDALRHAASILDGIGPTSARAYFRNSITYHPQTYAEAAEIMAALPLSNWTAHSGSSSYWLKSVIVAELEVTVFLQNKWLSELQRVLTMRAEAARQTANA